MRNLPAGVSRLFAVLLVLGACAFGGSPGTALAAERALVIRPALVIRDVTVIDAVNGVRKAQSIVVRGGTIARVGAVRDVRVPRGAQVIDGHGRYAIPGLWDMHTHPTYIPDLDLDSWYPLLIANGVTSIRNMGAPLDLALKSRDGSLVKGVMAPRVFIAGPLVDGPQPLFDYLSVTVRTPEEVRAAIDSLKRSGASFIKLYEKLTPEVFVAGVRHAHELGLPVAAHVPFDMDLMDVAATGVDSLEHLRYFEMACSSDWAELLAQRRTAMTAPPATPGGSTLMRDLGVYNAQSAQALKSQDKARCDRLMTALVANHVFQTPTMANMLAPSKRYYLTPQWRATLDYIPASVRRKWREGAAHDAASPVTPYARDLESWENRMIVDLKAHGAKFLTGTDTPSEYQVPGFSLHEELRMMVAAGLTPMEVLSAATWRPAEFMRIQDKVGTIDAGKWADIVLLNANPLDDIGNTEAIAAVIKDGHVYDRAALDRSLAALKARNADPAK